MLIWEKGNPIGCFRLKLVCLFVRFFFIFRTILTKKKKKRKQKEPRVIYNVPNQQDNHDKCFYHFILIKGWGDSGLRLIPAMDWYPIQRHRSHTFTHLFTSDWKEFTLANLSICLYVVVFFKQCIEPRGNPHKHRSTCIKICTDGHRKSGANCRPS